MCNDFPKSVLYFMYSNPCNSQPRPNSIFPFHFPLKSFDMFQKTMNLHCNLLSSEDWKLRGGFHETTCKLGQSSSIKVIIFVTWKYIYPAAGHYLFSHTASLSWPEAVMLFTFCFKLNFECGIL